MCGQCRNYLQTRRSVRELVYAEGQPLNRYDESLIESMMAMLKLRNPEHSIQLEQRAHNNSLSL